MTATTIAGLRRRHLCRTLKMVNLLAAGKSTAFVAAAIPATTDRQIAVQKVVDAYGPDRDHYRRAARKLMAAVLEDDTTELMSETSRPIGRAA